MSDSTPPFSALRALEAATRHRSFTWAARELNITHSAVSQAVRRLETELGARLFERRGGAMEPSEAAKRLAESYSAAAQKLTEVIRDITGDEGRVTLAIAMPEEIARLWMPLRAPRLQEVLSDIDVAVKGASGRAAEADVELLVVSRPRGNDQPIAALTVAPACSPEYAQRARLDAPADLLAADLLGDASDAWSVWAGRYAPGARPRVRRLETTEAMLEAAARGEGVAMTHELALQPYLATGRLRLSPFAAETGRTLVLRSRATPSKQEPVERLALWLRLEIARDAAQMRKLPGLARP